MELHTPHPSLCVRYCTSISWEEVGGGLPSQQSSQDKTPRTGVFAGVIEGGEVGGGVDDPHQVFGVDVLWKRRASGT